MNRNQRRAGCARERALHGVHLGLATLAMAGTIAIPQAAQAQAQFPPGGSDAFESTLTVLLDIPGLGSTTLVLTGPTVVLRSDPAGDPCAIDTEIVSIEASVDQAPFGRVDLSLDPAISSTGRIESLGSGCTFPADSYFDVYVRVFVEALGFELVNLEAVRVQNSNLQVIPPFFDSYVHPPPAIGLVQAGTTGPVIATIAGDSTHRVEQLPTFSVDASGPSSLRPADLHDTGNPPPANIPLENIQLATGDNVNALSYGLDVFDDFEDEDAMGSVMVAFSVDPSAVGRPNTGVNRQASQPTPEAYGDEFITYFDGSNIELVDEQALVLREGTLGDDLDALTGQPTSYPDMNEDMTPERPVFFSLAPGSPSLTGLVATAGDILVSQNGTTRIYAAASDMGLVPGDDVDALCLQKSGLPDARLRPGSGPPGPPQPGNAQFDYALISLAPGSPTLAAQGYSQGDLLVTDFSSSRPQLVGTPPALYAEANRIGLEDGDNLNALKCLLTVVFIEIDHPDDDGILVINLGGTDSFSSPLGSYAGQYNVWSIRNGSLDMHGPYWHPESPDPDPGHFPLLDPFLTPFVGGKFDNCGYPHVHQTFEKHADPDPAACGHGVFVPLIGPDIWIDRCTDTRIVVGNTMDGIDATVAANPHLPVTASMHHMSSLVGGVPAASRSHGHPRGGAGPEPPGVALMLVGAGRTNIEVDVVGGIGPDVGVPTPALPVPLVPEPSAAFGWLASLAALARIGRRRASR